ncbi:tripartite tricarboxylate transporter substrate binding protein [Candidimonas sp. SYP-B2681]|uniref:tripartite tricarboxylate transporter substrate binding protein n=1 Tax=Candidimonas sp. SYP-B2681 TaxID=2497686 RepID=UPI000F8676C9|nr:tripartite tricarboxylate transporter substrate binding protein [Candidimonas sp. SYP-B2681]RTZ41689.1 tripartite tricarboxylate transporter substrate binding protein [Candidimonas sp. SYP-B2681]
MKSICKLLVASLMFGTGFTASAASAYPNKPVTLMVPYPAGGVSDAIARAISGPLGQSLGQTVLVENLGGASGTIGAQKVLNAPADGYMVFLGSPNEIILAPLANKAIKVRAEDFTMLTQLTLNPLVLIASKDLPANSLDELLAYAKSAGRPLNYGSVGIGSAYHLITESMAQKTDIKVMHVPYKGIAPLLQDLGGSVVDFAMLPYGTSYRGLADQKRIKLLGWVGRERRELDSAIPAFGEGKNLQDFNQQIWAGLMVKKGTPADIQDRLHKAIGDTMKDPAVRKALSAVGSEVAPLNTLVEAEKLLAAETNKYRVLAKEIKLQPE